MLLFLVFALPDCFLRRVLQGAYIAALEGTTQESVAALAQCSKRHNKAEAELKKLEGTLGILQRWTPDMSEFKVNLKLTLRLRLFVIGRNPHVVPFMLVI